MQLYGKIGYKFKIVLFACFLLMLKKLLMGTNAEVIADGRATFLEIKLEERMYKKPDI